MKKIINASRKRPDTAENLRIGKTSNRKIPETNINPQKQEIGKEKKTQTAKSLSRKKKTKHNNLENEKRCPTGKACERKQASGKKLANRKGLQTERKALKQKPVNMKAANRNNSPTENKIQAE